MNGKNQPLVTNEPVEGPATLANSGTIRQHLPAVTVWKVDGPTPISEHNPQQSHNWNQTERLVWSGHECEKQPLEVPRPHGKSPIILKEILQNTPHQMNKEQPKDHDT